MKSPLVRLALPIAAASMVVGPITACSKPETVTTETTGAATVSVSDQWVKATDKGMTGLFGTLRNSGEKDMTVVSAASPTAGMVELHEVVGQPGSGAMRPKDGGFVIPAGGSHLLVPGGDHIMLMDLKAPLKVGSDVKVTLTFADGTSMPFTAQVRDYAGAEENYEPGKPSGQ